MNKKSVYANLDIGGLKRTGCTLRDAVDHAIWFNRNTVPGGYYDESFIPLIPGELLDSDDGQLICETLDKLRFAKDDQMKKKIGDDPGVWNRVVNSVEINDDPKLERLKREIKFLFNVASIVLHWYDGPQMGPEEIKAAKEKWERTKARG